MNAEQSLWLLRKHPLADRRAPILVVVFRHARNH
jgi:hypothetical protein